MGRTVHPFVDLPFRLDGTSRDVRSSQRQCLWLEDPLTAYCWLSKAQQSQRTMRPIWIAAPIHPPAHNVPHLGEHTSPNVSNKHR